MDVNLNGHFDLQQLGMIETHVPWHVQLAEIGHTILRELKYRTNCKIHQHPFRSALVNTVRYEGHRISNHVLRSDSEFIPKLDLNNQC